MRVVRAPLALSTILCSALLLHTVSACAQEAQKPAASTTTPELAELALKAKPRLLILYHYNGLSQEELVADMLARYPRPFVVGRDLDVY
ncbi:MAG: hypothetical protein ABI580_11890 [Burkholderiaceae bacterium]